IAPLRLDGETLTVAISQIEHPNLISALSDITGYRVDPLIYPEAEIRTLLDSSYRLPTERGLELYSFGENIFTVVDSAKKIKPLHGRFLVRIHERKIVLVVSAFPTIYGFRFLLEMFDERLLKRNFDDVTAAFPALKKALEDFLLHNRQGISIITAPDGSGRTTFLYSLLLKCKEDERQIITLEDSVRYPIQGATQ